MGCGTSNSPLRVVSSYSSVLLDFLTWNKHIFFNSPGLRAAVLWHPALTNVRDYLEGKDTVTGVKGLLDSFPIGEVLGFLYYYVVENQIGPRSLKRVDTLCRAMGPSMHMDYFVLKLLVYIQPQELPAQVQNLGTRYFQRAFRA